MFGAIEAGGTKLICAYGTTPENLTYSEPLPTGDPEETLQVVKEFFDGRKLKQVGVACFGPLDLRKGQITKSTPKIAWRGVAIAKQIEKALGAPVVLDTDVNGALLAEVLWGAAKGSSHAVFVTVGTGIGAGLMVEGRLVHGRLHPELGHIRVRKFLGDRFEGNCPTHRDCLEGLAAGPAIAARWGVEKAELLPENHSAWPLEAHYLGQMVVNLACTTSPDIVLMGGGIGLKKDMISMVRQAAEQEMLGYAPLPKLMRPKLGARAGVMGAFALAKGLKVMS